MRPTRTLLLTRREVAALLSLDECIAAVENAFRLYGEGKTSPPGILGIHATNGGFHIKAGLLKIGRTYFVAKANANFPQNIQRFGLPTIQGIIMLSDAENGYPLALLDSMEITILRTGAATAVAAKYLARPESNVVTVCGCGNQGRIQLRALAKVLPLERLYAFDQDAGSARQFADVMSSEIRLTAQAVRDLQSAVRDSDVCVTCTPAKEYFLKKEYVKPGTFIAAVGADHAEKQELDPQLFVSNKIIADILEQCATIGDLHHALQAGLVTKENVHAELGEVVAGKKAGRTSQEEIIIFDSTGMALQDAAAAAVVYEKAISVGKGMIVDFAN
ncbi:ornithine cyclodeaminase family protein [candidate division KSB1 bacterium]|nr:ornithine cyclodeaminase family protein [candidate division KSB1 bacterium]